MQHDTTLIALVAMGFVLACALGYLAIRVRLPPIVGYLVAGIAIGPFTPGFVGDAGMAGQLAEIGVIPLMFGVGLHFSVETLLAVLAGALISITLNPFVFATITPVARWVRARPALYAMLERGATRLATLPDNRRSETDCPETTVFAG